MKEIELTQGQVALVDDEDFDYLSQWKWQADWCKTTNSFYATRTSYFPVKTKIRMHREIMKTPAGKHCDHRNHDTLDNQKDNLRNITHSQSMMNRKLQKDNSLGERGIGKSGKGFRVRIRKDEVLVFDRWFKDLEKAKKERDIAYQQYHGEYGYTLDH